MAINPAISLGVKGIELQDPLAQYGRVAAIQGAQQQQQMNALQMRQAQKEQEDLNALNQAYSRSLNPQTGEIDINRLRSELAGGGLGSKLPAVEKQFGELRTQKLAQQKTEGEVLDAALKRQRQFLDTIDVNDPDAPARFIAWHEANHRDPVIGPVLAARGITADQARNRIAAAIMQGPEAFKQLLLESRLGTDKFIEMNKPTTQVIDQGGQRQVIQIPGLGGTPTTVGTYADVPMPPEIEEQKARIAAAGASRTNVNVATGKQEAEFEKELGKGQAKDLLESRAKAEDARDILSTVKIGRDILGSGAITGAGADFLIGLNQALKTAGVDMGYADASANSQAYMANMANNVGRLIKQFGAGTGLSNADREYAEKMAGGRISLDGKALQRILDINERAAQNVIKRHNKKVEGIKTNIPLAVEIEEAPAPKTSAAPNPPAVGAVQDGYRFKGGNPADAKNWEKVK